MTQKERVRAAIEHREPDIVPVGEWIIDYEPASLVLGRPTFVRGKANLAGALWDGRRDEIVDSIKRDTVELARRLDVDLVCADLVWPKGVQYERPEQIDHETWRDRNGNVLRYAEFLKRDFPRIPFTSDRAIFVALCARGAELVALHLMESPLLAGVMPDFPVTGSDTVERVHYNANEQRVYINNTQYFANIPSDVWSFHVGGYQVCEKWLKDRKGRSLSYDDQQHYQRIIAALRETIRLMAEIDALIPAWPIT